MKLKAGVVPMPNGGEKAGKAMPIRYRSRRRTVVRNGGKLPVSGGHGTN